jgi:hypothetical protein
MNLKKLRSAFVLGIGMSMSLTVGAFTADNPWEACYYDCLQRYQACLNGGGNAALCERNKQTCIWQCGAPY